MRWHRMRPVWPVTIALLLLGVAAAPGSTAAPPSERAGGTTPQVDAGYLAAWKDCELRVTERAGESVSTLALVPPAAPVILVFEARRQSRGPRQAPATVDVRAYLRPLADPRVRPRVELRLTVDAGEGRAVPLSFFGSSWGVYGFVAAGDEIPVVRFTMAPVELRALVAGEGVTGEVMGFSFALRRDQLDALRDFADLVESGNRTPR